VKSCSSEAQRRKAQGQSFSGSERIKHRFFKALTLVRRSWGCKCISHPTTATCSQIFTRFSSLTFWSFWKIWCQLWVFPFAVVESDSNTWRCQASRMWSKTSSAPMIFMVLKTVISGHILQRDLHVLEVLPTPDVPLFTSPISAKHNKAAILFLLNLLL